MERESPGSLRGDSPSMYNDLVPWAAENLGQKSEDVSPTLSNFSSCEGSDFERYCSANSVMGTPSICSSVGNHADLFGASDFVSLKNLGFGGDDFALDSCDLWETPESNFGSRNTAALSVRKISISDGAAALGFSLSSNSGTSLCNPRLPFIAGNRSNSQLSLCSATSHEDDNDERSEPLSSPKMGTYYGAEYERKYSENLSRPNAGTEPGVLSESAEVTSSHVPVSTENNDVGLMMSRTENGTLDAEKGKRVIDTSAELEVVSSDNYEYSDAEDLTVDYGTDEEKEVQAYTSLNQQGETQLKNENPLLINSAVAFGSDDWDDFEQEAWDYGSNPVTLSILHENEFVHEKTMDKTGERCKSEVFCQVEAGVISPENLQNSPLKYLSPKDELLRPKIQEVRCFEGDLNVVENFTKADDDASKRDLLCAYRNARTYETDLLDPLSGFTTNNVSSSENRTFQENAVEMESESNAHVCSREDIRSEKSLMEKSDFLLNPLPDAMAVELPLDPREELRNIEGKLQENYEVNVLPLKIEKESVAGLKQILNDSLNDPVKDCVKPDEGGKLGTFELYEEMVYDMEKILLGSGESRSSRFSQSANEYFSPRCHQFRDGSSTASTSGRDDRHPSIICPPKIDWVEVIGAKQKRGDVSLGERLVGVKEYTVYILRVWCGKEQWEVEHRYRDFIHLYRQLKEFYFERGQILPLPWLKVERDSRKFFGNASPTVVNERSFLIQDCLRSILDLQSISGTPSCLLYFLAPSKSSSIASLSNHSGPDPKNPDSGNIGPCNEVLTLGKTISLVVDLQPQKPVKQLLEAQHYVCAGCHKHFDFGKTLMSDFVQTLGWGKPRICEYTGQLFCASCHTNETAVLPARVLHLWDFALYPVSQMAKAYLESTYDQPMLCVTAVNPSLFSKVPALLHVMSIRRKIGSMVPYVRCPFRRSIQKGLGSRRYLLESSEFFALRDLVDLSKGAFSALPVMMENVSRKILDHITQQCLVCCDVGIMCGSRQACEDPSSLIFPFQEDEITRCKSCNTAFHKPCYMKLMSCPCRRTANKDGTVLLTEQAKHRGSDELIGDTLTMEMKSDSESVVGFFSKMFAKAKHEMAWNTRDRNPVILMGSMPSTTL